MTYRRSKIGAKRSKTTNQVFNTQRQLYEISFIRGITRKVVNLREKKLDISKGLLQSIPQITIQGFFFARLIWKRPSEAPSICILKPVKQFWTNKKI